jgi:predicted aspartyl protease
LVGGNIQAQSDQNQTEQIAEARRRVVAAPRFTRFDSPVVKVPLHGSKTLPLVEIKINGKGPYKLLVDSAANITLLQMRVADELKLPVLRPGDASKLVAVESIRIGDAVFKDLVVGARNWDEKIDGVIGFNLFADCLLTMDYKHQQLILREGELQPENGKDIFKYGLDNRSPTLEITVGGERFTVLVDTGAAQGLVIPERIASKLKFNGEIIAGPELKTFDTPKSRARIGRLAGNINIGIHEISKPLIHIWEDVPVIGSAFLKEFIITFDQKNQTLRISL